MRNLSLIKIVSVFLLGSLCMIQPFASAQAGEAVAYNDGATALEGYWSPSACKTGKTAPLVLIAHQWKGLGDNEKMRADMLSAKCYNAFALDMYGKGIRPQSTEDATKESNIYKNDPTLARQRITAALNYAKGLEGVDATKIAVIGYCFGGAMALELARSGADIKGAITFHGALATKAPVTKPGVIKAAIQVHHGAEDPFVKQEEVSKFMDEMRASNTDWSITQYAHAVHAFTQKDAGNDPSKGLAYNEIADKRSWQSSLNFLSEIFGQ